MAVGDSVETSKIKNTNTPPLNEVHVEDFTARLAAMKAFFINEIFGLKTCCTTADVADYIKPIVRSKPEALGIHTGTK